MHINFHLEAREKKWLSSEIIIKPENLALKLVKVVYIYMLRFDS